MQDFESGFARVEAALDELDRRVRDLQGRMRRLRAAAKTGDVRQLRDAQAKLGNDRPNMDAAMRAVSDSWPFSDADELTYLRDDYAAELVSVAGKRDVEIFERDGRLLAFPVLLRVDAVARRVRINKRQLATLRPSALVSVLKVIQGKGASFNAQAFIAVLWRAWRVHTRNGGDSARQVGLLDIHHTLTLLPSARKEYDLTEFGRDLLLLDESGVETCSVDKKEYQLEWLRASTSSKGGRFVSTVDRSGQQVGYAAIDFRSVP